jgi:phage terminase large subunit-like protein
MVPEPLGRQEPTFMWVPPFTSTLGLEVVDLAKAAGLILDPWQQFVIHQAFAENDVGGWSCFEVGLVVSRQNGKGSILEAAELAWLFLFHEQLIIHSAHLFETSREHFFRIKALIENTDEFRRQIRKPTESRGAEEIQLLRAHGGGRLRFMTRKGGSTRGFTASKLVMDEAMYLDETMMAAGLPTMATVPDAQVWYTGSAGMRHSTQLASVRRRAYAGGDAGLAYMEWAADPRPVDEGGDDRADPATWAKANPGLGIRISPDYIRKEAAALGGPWSTAFGTERLGIGDWPTEDEAWDVIPEVSWQAHADPDSQIPDGSMIALGLHADADRQVGTINVCGLRSDGRRHVEVVERHRGTSWMVDTVKRMAELKATWRPCVTVVLKTAAAATTITALEKAKIPVVSPSEAQYSQACGTFLEAFTEGDAVHLDQQSMNRAVGGARKRENVEGCWRWSQQLSTADVGPAIAGTLAMWGLDNYAVTVPRSKVW